MSPTTAPRNRSERVRQDIRNDILRGFYSPGEKLRLTELSERYGTSSTVVREALTRLVGEHLACLKPNHGFSVQDVNADSLKDLVELRCRNEEFGIQLAIERGDLDWESELLAVHHQLERAELWDPDTHLHTSEWNDAHRDFHLKLIEPAGIPLLHSLCATLFDLALLYSRWSDTDGLASGRDIAKEHREIMQATINRESTKASRLIREHYERTFTSMTRNSSLS